MNTPHRTTKRGIVLLCAAVFTVATAFVIGVSQRDSEVETQAIAGPDAAMFATITAKTNLWMGGMAAGTNVTSVFVINSSQLSSATYAAATSGTNVTSIRVAISSGTNHTFYYLGRLRWEWAQARKRLGFRVATDGQRLALTTSRAYDHLWLTCKYHGPPPNLRDIRVQQVLASGRWQTYGFFDGQGICDKKRGVMVIGFPLLGGLKNLRGNTLHIQDTSNGTESLVIQFR